MSEWSEGAVCVCLCVCWSMRVCLGKELAERGMRDAERRKEVVGRLEMNKEGML